MSVYSRNFPLTQAPVRSAAFAGSNTLTGRRKSSRAVFPEVSRALTPEAVALSESLSRDCSCQIETLLNETDFAQRHEGYSSIDAILGTIICLVSSNGSRFNGVIFSIAGPLILYNQETTHLHFSEAGLSLRQERIADSLATLVDLHLQRIPLEVLDVLESRGSSSLSTRQEHVAQIVASLKPLKDISISSSLLHFLLSKQTRTIDVDVILGEQSPLQRLLPPAAEVQDKNAELTKVPIAPEKDNVEKCSNLLHEILATEKTYVNRLHHLLKDYANPLRTASRRQRGILGTYETNTLFPTTLDAILLLNEDFLKSLEAAAGDLDFALVLAKGFEDFRKIYSRYLEVSSDVDDVLRAALKIPKFKEFTDKARASANANIGIRELVMEPVSRIPRYSLLISSLLAAMAPTNPAYRILREALFNVRRIGRMEKDQVVSSQETIMKLSALVSSWPADLVKSSITVVCYVDCLDMLPISSPMVDRAVSPTQGHLCTLVLCSDRLIFLKRAKSHRFDDILSSGKRGELGYRGYISLESVMISPEEDCLNLLLMQEVSGISSPRWIARPYRRIKIRKSELSTFLRNFNECRAALKICSPLRYVESFQDTIIHFHVYTNENWQQEIEERKSSIRIWHEFDDEQDAYCNLSIVESEPNVFSCSARSRYETEMLCHNVASMAILKDIIYERLIILHQNPWLQVGLIQAENLCMINATFATTLTTTSMSSTKTRPVSPSKLVFSLLGRKDLEAPTSRSKFNSSAGSVEGKRESAERTIVKKKSNSLFSFGNENKSILAFDTFVEALMEFEHFEATDLSATNAIQTKQANALAVSITKDPKKSFAILGSPTKIALHAFKVFCRSTLTKRLGGASILNEENITDLRSHLKYEHEAKLTRMRSVLKTAPKLNLQLLKSVLGVAIHVLSIMPADAKIPTLLLFSDMLVPPLSVTSFLSTLEVLIENVDDFFVLKQDEQFATIDSKTSCMTVPDRSSLLSSCSTRSRSFYTTDCGTLASPLNSPLKQSCYSLTPDLIEDFGSSDAPVPSDSPSGSPVSTNQAQNSSSKLKRATIHIEKASDVYETFGFRRASAEMPSSLSFEEGIHKLPQYEFALPRSQSDQVTYTQSTKFAARRKTSVDTMSTSNIIPLQTAQSERHSTSPKECLAVASGTYESSRRGRRVTPSKIPVASPKSSSSPRFDASASTEPHQAASTLSLASRKGSGIPRLPSLMVRRKESRQLSQAFEEAISSFDAEMALDYCNMLQFSEAVSDDCVNESECDVALATSAINYDSSSPLAVDNLERKAIRHEISGQTKMTSAATIRRVSRQLQKTSIGALSEDPEPCRVSSAALTTNASQEAACARGCQETIELLKLELDHYKAIYRASVEEIDVTLDLANEQIEDLQKALHAGSLEAAAMRMLELEREENRKLRMKIAALSEHMA